MFLNSLRNKALFFSAICIAFLLVQVVMLRSETLHVIEQVEYLEKERIPQLNKAHEMQVAVIQVQQWLTDISATRAQDGLNDGFEMAEENAQLFRSRLKEMMALDSENADSYRKLLPVFDAYYSTGKKMAQGYIDGGPAIGNQLMGEFDGTASAIYERIGDLMKTQDSKTQAALTAALQKAKQSQWTSMLFSALLAGLIVLLLSGLRVFVLAPISKMHNLVEDLGKGEGDLSQRLPENRKDEIGDLARSFNHFLAKTDQTVANVMKSVVRLIPMADELSHTNEHVQDRTLKQNEQSQKVHGGMLSTKDAAQSVSSAVERISAATDQGYSRVGHGLEIVKESSINMERLAERVSSAEGTINRLQESSDRIEGVIDVIGTIAEQTNLLALNAAIEAARAGEAGRGFAVVADEVRSLAGKTHDSTLEVQSMVEAIRNETASVVSVMRQSVDAAKDSKELVEASRTSLEEINEAIVHIRSCSEEILAALQIQNTNFDEVSYNIDVMDEYFKETLSSGQLTFSFGDDLKKMSGKLQEMMATFKVTDNSWSTKRREKPRVNEDAELF
ncbi:methyl-accepting chemotaxis protein [Oceanospirillum sanctuarii]|uniref:methyl-accepting chemotaxis protein n=1 Tax=Oceanospirillum sanctuarii TaxID=1434821 RepID=UPI000A377E93|nr:methyl-accepting chemotaxis protein [Oceanospirillum sanctuarii]